MKRHSEYRICFCDRSLFETDPRQLAGETIGTDRVRFLKGWWYHVEKKKIAKVAIDDLMSKVTGFITTCSKKYAENDTFPFFSLSLPSLFSLLFLFPLLYLSFLLQLSVFPLFIIFCSLSQPGRSRLGRWTFWNDLAIASRCFFFLFFFPLFLTFILLSLLFFLNPCNVGHSSREAKSGKNRVPPATRVYARHLYINHVRFKHHDRGEFGQNMFILIAHLRYCFNLSLRFIIFKIFWMSVFYDIFFVFYGQKLG